MTAATPAAPAARHLAALIGRGELSPADLALRTLERIATEDPALGAFVCTLTPQQAAAQARQLHGPLAGVPVAVKDIFDTRDLPTAYGSPAIYPPRPAAMDAAVVSVLRRAGGLVVGKSTTTEFAYLQPTATRNPKAPSRTPGGSSAGSAAAVAAGLVPLALGTQTGGSVIRPASYCGVVGYKPSFGWLPTTGLKCFSWSLDTVGLFARDVADVAWFAQALCGRALTIDETGAAAPRRVAVAEAYPWGALSGSAGQALAQGRRALQAAGIDTPITALPDWAGPAFDAHAAVQGYEAWRCLQWELDTHPDALSPLLREYLQSTRTISAADYEAAQAVALQARAQAQAWLQDADLLLTPSAPDEAPPGLASTGESSFNRLWTLLGVPCVSVPGLVGENGAPMGLQLIGPWGSDARLLAAAWRLQQALG